MELRNQKLMDFQEELAIASGLNLKTNNGLEKNGIASLQI